jgi:cardiolipin hydrolase
VVANKLNKPKRHLKALRKAICDRLKGRDVDLLIDVLDLVIDSFYTHIPVAQETMFFPSKESEIRLARQLRKAQTTLDVAVFAFTNNILRDAILDCWGRGVKCRVITDDECSKFPGADIFELASKGIPCTMDDNPKFHMHNKFAIIDSGVLVTGSFNWTAQAVNGNQENLVVIENPLFVADYQQEYDRLWE